MSKNEKDINNQSIRIKIDGLTPEEANKYAYESMKMKTKIAPNSRGTITKGPTKEFNKIEQETKMKNIEGENNKNGKKKK